MALIQNQFLNQTLLQLGYKTSIQFDMPAICPKHQRETTIYDLQLHQTICERCALFEPLHNSHAFIETSQLPYHAQQLSQNIQSQIHSLQLLQRDTLTTSQRIQDHAKRRACEERERINKKYDSLVEELERERSLKIEQAEEEINKCVEESNREMNSVVAKQYENILTSSQRLSELYQLQQYSEVCRLAASHSLSQSLASLQKNLEMIHLSFDCRMSLIAQEVPYFLPLAKRHSQKQELLLSNIENQFIHMFDSLKSSRVSATSDARTQISFGSFKDSDATRNKPLSKLGQPAVSQKKSLSTLKVHSKSQVKKLYIKNSVKSICMSQLDMNNREAMEAIRKCSFNNFVCKLDLSFNKLSEKLVVQLKKEKIESKYLKVIIVKGIQIDGSELKKQGVSVVSVEGKSIIQIGNIRLEY